MKDATRVVVIGGGITGCCVLYHLAKEGWTDAVLLEKNEITSGATCMAVGLLTQFNASPTMMRFRKYSAELYDSLGAYEKVGSLRIASSKNQHKTLLRDVSQAKGIGLELDIIGPGEAMKIMPWMSDKDVYSAVYLPQDGHLDPHGATHAVAKAARELGAEIHTHTRVTGINVSAAGEVTGVKTDKGEIRCEMVVNAAGLWGAQVAAMAGIQIPCTPVLHQYSGLGAVSGAEIPEGGPCFRDTDYLIYGRPEHGGLLVGAWETNPKSCWEDGVPWTHSATDLPNDLDRFEPLLENAVKRFPFLAEAGIERIVCHPDAFTPDSKPMVGPWPGIQGLWSACGLSMNGFGGAGGIGKSLAEWMVHGDTEVDLYGYHPWRFGRNYLDPHYADGCARECYRYYYYTRYPNDEDTEMRPRRISPAHHRLQDMGAVFGKKNGWERVNYFDPEGGWRRAGEEQREYGGWVKPPYFDTVAKECRAFRKAAGIVDLTSFGKISVSGKDALALLQKASVSDLDQAVGNVFYTQFCNHKGGILADVTITRLANDRFRVVTGSGYIDNDLGHLKSLIDSSLPAVDVQDVSEALACFALWGPSAGEILESITNDDISGAALPYMTAKVIEVSGVPILAQRLSYVGETGWEMYIPKEMAIFVWDAIWEAGQKHHLAGGGYKALGSLRLEKGYLHYGGDITSLENPFQAGIGFTVHLDKPADFVGRSALESLKETHGDERLFTVLIGEDEWLPLYGGEAVIADGRVIGRLRSVGYGHTVKKNIGYAYLPKEKAKMNMELEVEIFGENVSARVAPRTLYDPKGKQLKG